MSRRSFRHLELQNPSTGDDFILSSGIFYLVLLFTTMRVVAPLKDDPILSGRSILSFRHLELQNPSIISDFRHRDRMPAKICRRVRKKCKLFFLVPFFTTMEVAAPLKNYPILSGRSTGSFRHLELQNPSIISDFINRQSLVQKSTEEEQKEQVGSTSIE